MLKQEVSVTVDQVSGSSAGVQGKDQLSLFCISAVSRCCYGNLVQYGVAGCDSATSHRRGELLRLLSVPAGHRVRGQNHPGLRHRGLLGASLLPAVGSRLRGPLLLLQRMWLPPPQLLHGRTRVGVELRDGRVDRQAGAPRPQPAASVRTSPGLLPPPGGGLRRHRGPVGLQLQDLTQVQPGRVVSVQSWVFSIVTLSILHLIGHLMKSHIFREKLEAGCQIRFLWQLSNEKENNFFF